MTMPPVEGPITSAKDGLRLAFARSPEAATFFDATTEAAILQRILLDVVAVLPDGTETIELDKLRDARPFLCIWRHPVNALTAKARALDVGQFGGGLMFYGEKNVSSASDRYPDIDISVSAEVTRWWDNVAGLLLKGAFNAANTSQNRILTLRTFEQVACYRVADERAATLGDYCALQGIARWGVQ